MMISEDCGGGEGESRDKVKSTGRGSADSGTEVLADFTYVRKVTEKCDECPKAFRGLFSSISFMLNTVSFCLSVVIEDKMHDEADMLRAVGTFEGPEHSVEDDEG